MNVNEVSRFKGLLKVLNIVYLIGIVLTGLSTALLAGLTIFISTLSERRLKDFLTADNSRISLDIGGMDYQFTNSYIAQHLEVNKGMLCDILILAVLIAILVFFIMWFARKLVQSFSNNQVFVHRNGTYIEIIAILFLIGGHVYQLLVSLYTAYIDKAMDLSTYLMNKGVVDEVSHHYFNINFSIILIAVTIWLIGRAFKYGAFLQDEYDATV